MLKLSVLICSFQTDGPDPDHPIQEIRWGPRARLEVKKRDVLEFMCDCLYDCKPESFREQMARVVAEEPDLVEDEDGDE